MSDWVGEGIGVRARKGTYLDAFTASNGRQVPRETGVVCLVSEDEPDLWRVDPVRAIYNSSAQLMEEWEPIPNVD